MTAITADGLGALKPTGRGPWEPRRALTLEAARRRTAFVGLLRVAFLLAAAGIVALLAVQVVNQSRGAVVETAPVVSPDLRMTNPRFTGRDENQTPFTVTADLAVRRDDSPSGITELERPRLDYNPLSGGSEASQVIAETGLFDPTNRILDLFQNVNLTTDEGYTFSSSHARIFLREQRVAGDEPVEGRGPMGQIEAQSYEILDGGDTVIFEGQVRARFVQDRTDPSVLDAPWTEIAPGTELLEGERE
ncbi:LPS export ABC transporter periplasmic protein LptC [Maricaulis sp. D1M11]|uniref:LPS export ABC transporter periplasmic protein LptC n=1 Tax=Maricaulis sp. D1M11 TaxID=3076117 RepID=UPI0039B39FEC